METLGKACFLPFPVSGDSALIPGSWRYHSDPRLPVRTLVSTWGPQVTQDSPCISRPLTASAECVLSGKVTHSQVPGIRTGTPLGAIIVPPKAESGAGWGLEARELSCARGCWHLRAWYKDWVGWAATGRGQRGVW